MEVPRAGTHVHVKLPSVTGFAASTSKEEGEWEHIESEEERRVRRRREARRLRRKEREVQRRGQETSEASGENETFVGARVRVDLPVRTPVHGTFVDARAVAARTSSPVVGRDLNVLSRRSKRDASDPAGAYATLPFSPMRLRTSHPPMLLDTPGIIAAVRNSERSYVVTKLEGGTTLDGSAVRNTPPIQPPSHWQVIARAVTAHEGYHHLSDRARERAVRPTPSVHAIWTQLKAGDTVLQAVYLENSILQCTTNCRNTQKTLVLLV